MFLTGFADEAGADFATQIKATSELGWKFIETRAIGSKNLASLTEAEFEDMCSQLDAAGISISCYGSAVASWNKHPRKEEDFVKSREELLAAIPRMHKLGVKGRKEQLSVMESTAMERVYELRDDLRKRYPGKH